MDGARTAWTGALLCALALAAAGCGGDSGERSESGIPAALAVALAETSDEIAAQLEAGDGCAAAELASDLRARAEAAVDDGTVPATLAEPLLDAVARLDDDLACEPEPEEDEDDADDESDDSDDSEDWPPGKAKGKDKDKDRKEKDR